MRSRPVNLSGFPIRPVGNVLEVLVERSLFQVFSADNAVPSARIDEVLELDTSFSAVSVPPGCRRRSAKAVNLFSRTLLESYSFDFGLVENSSTTGLGVPEQQIIGFRG